MYFDDKKKSACILSAVSILKILLPERQSNEKIYDSFEPVEQCKFINELVSSEGTWYNYLFISNKELTIASVNDLKNQASEIGANAVHIQYNLNFNTSVTFFAQAYKCEE